MVEQLEKKIVEDYMIKKLVEEGWKHVPGKDLDRESYEEVLLIRDLIRAIKRINKNFNLSDEDIKKVISELKLRGTGQEGSKAILNFLKNGISIKLEKTNDLVRVKLFDYKNLENNDFLISNQVEYHTTTEEKKPDIILFINGIPLVIIECKDPGKLGISWEDAYKQIKKDYEKNLTELFKYVQIGIAAESIAKYFPIVAWQENVQIYEWKDEEKKKNPELGKDISMSSLIKMLSTKNILDIIKNYLFFREERGEKTKVITRYMQRRAAEKIFNRVKENINKKTEKNKGLVWHWQGSGKTLTMIFAAHKLYFLKELENPTVFFIVDRRELEEQLYNEFNALGITSKIESISSIRKLKENLRHDEGKGKRGFFVVLIHKFREEELRDLAKELEEKSKENETIMNRKNILAFIDESHRTQYGLLAAQMKRILKNAFFFAFTGTPISKKEKNTYDEFAYPPEEPCLDKYFVADSINDGFTVKIAYQPRLEKVEGVHFDKKTLNLLLEVSDEEIPEEKREELQEKVKKRINIRKIYYENKERIGKIAKDIAKHFKENIDGKFKAMVVGVDRKACVLYKRELDKYLPKTYSEVVMTFTKDDVKEIKDYLKELRKKYPNKEIGDIRKEIVNKFKDDKNPQILIVTDMLLTGFDAPILQTMYLDKPLREHKLLQAIARTNRPYKDVKEAGLIVDYLGILKDFKKAFEIYSKDEIRGALFNKEELKKEFIELIKNIQTVFKNIKRDQTRENILKAIERLSDEAKAKEFIKNYKDLRKKFELLGSDVIRARYSEEFSWLSYIYAYYLRQITQKEEFEDQEFLRKYFAKTLKYIHKTTKIDDLKDNLPIIDFDEEYIQKIGEKYKTKEEKAANIIFTLNRYVLVDQNKDTIYESLADKVEKLINLWKEKTKDFEKIYQQGLEIIKERNRLLERQKKLKLSDFEYSILLLLEMNMGKNKGLIKHVKDLSNKLKKNMFPRWYSQITVKKDIEKEIRKFLIKYVREKRLKLEKIDVLSIKIMDNLKKYEKRG